IAAGLAWLGYWMVLPFSGLEMLALAVALWWGMRDNSYREVVCVDDRYVRVESGWRHPQRHWQYERAWAQLRLEPGPYASSPTRLWLGSHGKGCILGGCLTNEEREAVARKLRHWLRADKVGASADRNWR
ncbi:MAG: DUF2244 domain-containing protein, partial [Salinisphaera sp.]|nr:DUF2244 domain-containing protein [Salinisphaera sp.]